MQLFLTTKIWKEGTHFIAYTPELDLSSQGKTPAQADQRLRETVEIFIDETKRLGTLNEVLRASGFMKRRRHWESPRISLSTLEVGV